MRGDQQLSSSNPELGEYKGSVVDSCPLVLHVCFNCVPGFSVILHPGDRMEGLEELLLRNLRTVKVVYRVNVVACC